MESAFQGDAEKAVSCLMDHRLLSRDQVLSMFDGAVAV